MSNFDKNEAGLILASRGIFLSYSGASGGPKRGCYDGFLMDFDILWILTFLEKICRNFMDFDIFGKIVADLDWTMCSQNSE